MNLYQLAENVHSKTDLICLIQALSKDLRENPDDWENDTLEKFLDAMSAWIQDMNHDYIHNHLPVPNELTWRVVGDILMAARAYE